MLSVGDDSTVPALGTVRLSMTSRVVDSLTLVISRGSEALAEEEEEIYARMAAPSTSVNLFSMEIKTLYVPTISGSTVAEY